MTLAEKMAQKSDNLVATQDEIVNEIVNSFKKAFDDGKLEASLTKWIGQSESAQMKREYRIPVEFWNYSSGCSDTNFHVFNIYWNNPENPHGYESWNYKGVRLHDIQHKVGNKLLNLTDYYLKDMGFRTHVENKETWLKYFDKEIVINW